MAKQKRQKLYCDEMAESNMRLIRKVGGTIDADGIVPIVAYDYYDYLEQLLSRGMTEERARYVIEKKIEMLETRMQMVGLTALNNWYWNGRQVYRFDKDFAALLYAQTKEDVDVDIETLNQLPIQHFYVCLEDGERYGFFVSISSGALYISDMQISHTESFVIPIPPKAKKISDILVGCNKEYGVSAKRRDAESVAKVISKPMQFIVYLSAINAEISPVTKGAIVERKSAVRHTVSRDKTEISDVGYRIGEALRAQKQERANVKYIGEHGHGAPKAPHIRRSHFHSFWTGSGDNKQLVVKWVNTIFVNGADKDTSVSTVHDVKG